MFSNPTLSAMIKGSSSDYINIVSMVVNGIAKSEFNFLSIEKNNIVENGLSDIDKRNINDLSFSVLKLVDPILKSIINIIELQASQHDVYPCDLLAKHKVFKDLSQDRYEIDYLLHNELDKKSIEYLMFCECLAWYCFDLICKDFIAYYSKTTNIAVELD